MDQKINYRKLHKSMRIFSKGNKYILTLDLNSIRNYLKTGKLYRNYRVRLRLTTRQDGFKISSQTIIDILENTFNAYISNNKQIYFKKEKDAKGAIDWLYSLTITNKLIKT
ncbi:MAG: hypothetical protein ACOCP8_06295 [archaeon]